MPEGLAHTVVAVAVLLIGVGAWRSAGRETDRAGLAVLTGIAVPALLAMAVVGGLAAGPAPVGVALAAAAALTIGALRPVLSRRARTLTVAPAPVAVTDTERAPLRRAA